MLSTVAHALIKRIDVTAARAVPPTVVNAVLDTLQPMGIAHIDMPLTPARIWDAMRAAAQSSNHQEPQLR